MSNLFWLPQINLSSSHAWSLFFLQVSLALQCSMCRFLIISALKLWFVHQGSPRLWCHMCFDLWHHHARDLGRDGVTRALICDTITPEISGVMVSHVLWSVTPSCQRSRAWWCHMCFDLWHHHARDLGRDGVTRALICDTITPEISGVMVSHVLWWCHMCFDLWHHHARDLGRYGVTSTMIVTPSRQRYPALWCHIYYDLWHHHIRDPGHYVLYSTVSIMY